MNEQINVYCFVSFLLKAAVLQEAVPHFPQPPRRCDNYYSFLIFCLHNSVDEAYGAVFDRSKFRVSVRHDGQVLYVAAGKSTTTCLLDITYFPVDSQTCYVELSRSVLKT